MKRDLVTTCRPVVSGSSYIGSSDVGRMMVMVLMVVGGGSSVGGGVDSGWGW